MANTLSIGLTGGIASGKSTVSQFFKQLGAGIIDADEISHQLTAANTPQAQEILAHFGPEFASSDGELNRQKLATQIFEHPQDKAWLENYLHPQIREAMNQAYQKLKSTVPYCLWVIPLLAESTYRFPLERICVIDVNPTTQLNRLQKRNTLPMTTYQQLVNQQAAREARLAIADDVIDNNGDLAALNQAATSLHEKYLYLLNDKLAGNK